jgi:hypothetical protein
MDPLIEKCTVRSDLKKFDVAQLKKWIKKNRVNYQARQKEFYMSIVWDTLNDRAFY